VHFGRIDLNPEEAVTSLPSKHVSISKREGDAYEHEESSHPLVLQACTRR